MFHQDKIASAVFSMNCPQHCLIHTEAPLALTLLFSPCMKPTIIRLGRSTARLLTRQITICLLVSFFIGLPFPAFALSCAAHGAGKRMVSESSNGSVPVTDSALGAYQPAPSSSPTGLLLAIVAGFAWYAARRRKASSARVIILTTGMRRPDTALPYPAGASYRLCSSPVAIR